MSNELENMAQQCKVLDEEVIPKPAAEVEAAQAAQAAEISAEVEAAELATILQAVSGLFVPVFPSIATIYTQEACKALASATVPVMRKHGWTVPGFMAAWAEEIALAMVALPIGFATWQAVKVDIAKAEKEAEKKIKIDETIKPEIVEPVKTKDGQVLEPPTTPRG